jgi:hypothetical protein
MHEGSTSEGVAAIYTGSRLSLARQLKKDLLRLAQAGTTVTGQSPPIHGSPKECIARACYALAQIADLLAIH